VGDVDVRAAEGGGPHGHDDLARAGERIGQLAQLEAPRPGGRLDERLHDPGRRAVLASTASWALGMP
jgi:hypothetical protein